MPISKSGTFWTEMNGDALAVMHAGKYYDVFALVRFDAWNYVYVHTA